MQCLHFRSLHYPLYHKNREHYECDVQAKISLIRNARKEILRRKELENLIFYNCMSICVQYTNINALIKVNWSFLFHMVLDLIKRNLRENQVTNNPSIWEIGMHLNYIYNQSPNQYKHSHLS